MEIVKIDQHNLTDINKANQPFEIIGKIEYYFEVEDYEKKPIII